MRTPTLEEAYTLLPEYISLAIAEEVKAGATEEMIIEKTEELIDVMEERGWSPREMAAILGVYALGCIRQSVSVRDATEKHDA